MGSEALACEGKEGALLLRKVRLSRRQRADTARFVYSAHTRLCAMPTTQALNVTPVAAQYFPRSWLPRKRKAWSRPRADLGRVPKMPQRWKHRK